MIQHVIRQSRTGYAAKLHTNVCGRQVTWSRDAEATRFSSLHELFERARAYGLRDFDFYADLAPDLAEVNVQRPTSNAEHSEMNREEVAS